MLAQRLNITLSDDLVRVLRRTVPNGKRSQFIATAVEEKIKKKKKDFNKEWAKSLRANREYYEKVADEWEATEVEGWPD